MVDPIGVKITEINGSPTSTEQTQVALDKVSTGPQIEDTDLKVKPGDLTDPYKEIKEHVENAGGKIQTVEAKVTKSDDGNYNILNYYQLGDSKYMCFEISWTVKYQDKHGKQQTFTRRQVAKTTIEVPKNLDRCQFIVEKYPNVIKESLLNQNPNYTKMMNTASASLTFVFGDKNEKTLNVSKIYTREDASVDENETYDRIDNLAQGKFEELGQYIAPKTGSRFLPVKFKDHELQQAVNTHNHAFWLEQGKPISDENRDKYVETFRNQIENKKQKLDEKLAELENLADIKKSGSSLLNNHDKRPNDYVKFKQLYAEAQSIRDDINELNKDLGKFGEKPEVEIADIEQAFEPIETAIQKSGLQDEIVATATTISKDGDVHKQYLQYTERIHSLSLLSQQETEVFIYEGHTEMPPLEIASSKDKYVQHMCKRFYAAEPEERQKIKHKLDIIIAQLNQKLDQLLTDNNSSRDEQIQITTAQRNIEKAEQFIAAFKLPDKPNPTNLHAALKEIQKQEDAFGSTPFDGFNKIRDQILEKYKNLIPKKNKEPKNINQYLNVRTALTDLERMKGKTTAEDRLDVIIHGFEEKITINYAEIINSFNKDSIDLNQEPDELRLLRQHLAHLVDHIGVLELSGEKLEYEKDKIEEIKNTIKAIDQKLVP